MTTVTRREGVTQADVEAALAAFQDNPSPENEAAATRAFEAVTGHRDTCPDCRVKRAQFIGGLQKIREGDVTQGAAALARSIKGAVAINLRKIFLS